MTGSLVSEETCGHGKSVRKIMAFMESFIIYLNGTIVNFFPGDLGIPALLLLHQFEWEPVKTDNRVLSSILSLHQLMFSCFLLAFIEAKIEDMKPYL